MEDLFYGLIESLVIDEKIEFIEYVIKSMDNRDDVKNDLQFLAAIHEKFEIIKMLKCTYRETCEQVLSVNTKYSLESLRRLYHDCGFPLEKRNRANEIESCAVKCGRLDVLQWICDLEPSRTLGDDHHIYVCIFMDNIDMFKFIIEKSGKIINDEHLVTAKAFNSMKLVEYLESNL